MSYVQLTRLTGVLFVALAILANVPYVVLIQTFEYDDILRKPADYVLAQFQAGGISLILTWLVFGLIALLLTPASLLLHRVIDRPDQPFLTAATGMGALAGLLQAIGLMRWVFVVPLLSGMQADPATSAASRAAVAIAYQVIHQLGGVMIGEFLGQLLLMGWTMGVGIVMVRSPLFKAWVGWWGLFTIPLLLVGQSELLATILPRLPIMETTPLGFVLWEIWILLLGISLLRIPRQRLIPPTFTKPM